MNELNYQPKQPAKTPTFFVFSVGLLIGVIVGLSISGLGENVLRWAMNYYRH